MKVVGSALAELGHQGGGVAFGQAAQLADLFDQIIHAGRHRAQEEQFAILDEDHVQAGPAHVHHQAGAGFGQAHGPVGLVQAHAGMDERIQPATEQG